MLTESLLLSCVAGGAGFALAIWGTRLLVLLIPRGIAATAQVDARLLSFTAAVSLATGVLFGVLPAVRASRVGLVTPLRQGGVQSGVGAGGQKLRHVLVVAEIALAMVLLAGAALMFRSVKKLYAQDPGFRAPHVMTLQTSLPRPKYADFSRRSGFYREVVQRVETLPGVVAAGYVTYLPLADSGGGSLVTVENRLVDPKHMLIANVRVVSPDYFRAVGMTLRRGRLLARSDGADAPKVVVINDAMARDYWPGQDPLGRRFKRGVAGSNTPWWTVVGVVADMRQGGLNVPVRPEAYFPFEQADFFAPHSLAVRTTADPLAISEDVRREIWAVDKDQPVTAVMPLEEMVYESAAPARLEASLLAVFSGIALLLASLGIYGVLSFAVTQRTQEIGVRMALGAQPGEVLRMIVRQGLAMLAIGLTVGLAAALALSRLIVHLLFDVRPSDPLSYVSVALLLVVVTVLASYLPARRAMRVDPMIALRDE
jgi:predicted permease